MAIFVVAIHTEPETICNNEYIIRLLRSCYNLAVPFFFMASGFFLFRKTTFPIRENIDNSNRVKSYLKKILRLYIIWTIIYLPLTVYGFIKDGEPLHRAILIFVRNLILVGENYYSWPLWYLLGLFVSVALIYISDKFRLTLKTIIVIAIITSLVGSLSSYWENSFWGHTYMSIFKTTRNGLFVGFACTTLGAYSSSISTKQIHPYHLILLFTISIVLSYLVQNFMFSLVSTYFLFRYLTSVQFYRISYSTSLFLRDESTIIYFLHMLVVAFLRICVFKDDVNPIFLFILTFVIVFCIGKILYKYSNNFFYKIIFK